MPFLRTDRPPRYDHERSQRENFDEFFGWALGLKRGIRRVPQIAEEADLGMRQHPLGFWVVYLSERYNGPLESRPARLTGACTGIARANFYPPGEELRDDIHSHGFDFLSGCADGRLLNMRYYPDFSRDAKVPEGEGMTGYQSSMGLDGVNRTTKVTAAVIPTPRGELEVLEAGDTYAMQRVFDFHSVAAEGLGALTIFVKDVPEVGQPGQSLMLVGPGSPPPPAEY